MKDAKGHGSDPRGGRGNGFSTLDKAAGVRAGALMKKGMPLMAALAQARAEIRAQFPEARFASGAAATGHPKAAPVPTHPAHAKQARDMYGRTDADLKKDYGGPVRHFTVGSDGRSR